MSPVTLSDEELVANYRSTARDSAEQCVDELFQRYYERVARWCYRFTGERDAAADLAQDVFTKAYRGLRNFEGQAKFSTWLYTIVRHEAINAAKARSVRPEERATELPFDLPDMRSRRPDAAAEMESAARYIRQLLAECLDDTERIVFTLHYGDDVPLDAITRLLSLTNASGAKAYIVSAKRKLGRVTQKKAMHV